MSFELFSGKTHAFELSEMFAQLDDESYAISSVPIETIRLYARMHNIKASIVQHPRGKGAIVRLKSKEEAKI
jgi:hypothetical protein